MQIGHRKARQTLKNYISRCFVHSLNIRVVISLKFLVVFSQSLLHFFFSPPSFAFALLLLLAPFHSLFFTIVDLQLLLLSVYFMFLVYWLLVSSGTWL